MDEGEGWCDPRGTRHVYPDLIMPGRGRRPLPAHLALIVLMFPVITGELETVCKGVDLSLTCPAGLVLVFKSANYGRTRVAPCGGSGIYRDVLGECVSSGTLALLAQRCFRQNSCHIPAQQMHDVFGDPCPSVSKYLEVDYTCVPPTNITNICGQEEEVRAARGFLISDNYPHTYENGRACRVKLAGEEGQVLRIKLIDLELEYSSYTHTCYDFVVFIHTGVEPRTYCNPHVEELDKGLSYSLDPANYVLVSFESSTSNQYRGFLLEYEVIGCTKQDIPAAPRHGHIADYVASDFVLYECDDGYEMSPASLGFVQCRVHSWYGDPGECLSESTTLVTDISTPSPTTSTTTTTTTTTTTASHVTTTTPPTTTTTTASSSYVTTTTPPTTTTTTRSSTSSTTVVPTTTATTITRSTGSTSILSSTSSSVTQASTTSKSRPTTTMSPAFRPTSFPISVPTTHLPHISTSLSPPRPPTRPPYPSSTLFTGLISPLPTTRSTTTVHSQDQPDVPFTPASSNTTTQSGLSKSAAVPDSSSPHIPDNYLVRESSKQELEHRVIGITIGSGLLFLALLVGFAVAFFIHFRKQGEDRREGLVSLRPSLHAAATIPNTYMGVGFPGLKSKGMATCSQAASDVQQSDSTLGDTSSMYDPHPDNTPLAGHFDSPSPYDSNIRISTSGDAKMDNGFIIGNLLVENQFVGQIPPGATEIYELPLSQQLETILEGVENEGFEGSEASCSLPSTQTPSPCSSGQSSDSSGLDKPLIGTKKDPRATSLTEGEDPETKQVQRRVNYPLFKEDDTGNLDNYLGCHRASF